MLIPDTHELISNMRAFFQIKNSKLSYLSEEPLRAELFSSDQMERFGKTLAGTHQLSKKVTKDHLLKRLSDNKTVLKSNDTINTKLRKIILSIFCCTTIFLKKLLIV
jgi:hypothetical protein